MVYAALVVKKESTYPEMVMLSYENDIKRLVETKDKVSSQDYVGKLYTRGFKTAANTKVGYGDSLYLKVWQPLEKFLNGKTKLFVSLNGILNRINLVALAFER